MLIGSGGQKMMNLKQIIDHTKIFICYYIMINKDTLLLLGAAMVVIIVLFVLFMFPENVSESFPHPEQIRSDPAHDHRPINYPYYYYR